MPKVKKKVAVYVRICLDAEEAAVIDEACKYDERCRADFFRIYGLRSANALLQGERVKKLLDESESFTDDMKSNVKGILRK